MISLQIVSAQLSSAMPMPPTQASQPLELHDIHLPEQVSNLPTAIGWWLLAAIIIVSVFWFIKKFKTNKALNFDRNYALALIEKDTIQNTAELVSLLKWSAMQYFNRQQVAKLYGDEFQQFLQEQLPTKHQQEFHHLSNKAFGNQYQANLVQENESSTISSATIDNDCKNAVKLWLTHALPPKVNTTQDSSSQKQRLNKTTTKGAITHD